MNTITGFPPILPREPKILILGSMPSAESMRRQQYYAHPQNAFWKIAGTLFGFAPDLPYRHRVAALRRANVALWDVLESCDRAGSLDTAIRRASEKPNAIAQILNEQTAIAAVFLNGKKADSLFRRHVKIGARLPLVQLPSTSPANAQLSFEQKLAAWNVIRDYVE